jgi:hypothetical protein
VDAGAVGIPADTASWGTTYSHATHAFDRLLLDRAPWIDPGHFEAIRRDWTAYLDRMVRFGNNGVVVDAFMELVNFDRVGSGTEVYGPTSSLRARHVAARDAFSELFAEARGRGMQVHLKTDMLALTPELERYLVEATGGLDASDPRVWDVYARGLEEIFEELPSVAGVVIRIGEAGPLFNVSGLDYRTEMAVRTPDQLRLMLTSLLPAFERHDRRLIFRSWSVGVGRLGDLHNDPEVYLEALGGIDSPALVVSTKYTQGDYFGFLSPNPTLAVGSQKRLVEFQARREFEGFGAVPNFMGGLHRDALRTLRAANPRIVGTSLWTQEGGPLKAGPISLYPLSGFWRWIDANVWITSRLAADPGLELRAATEEWVRVTLTDDPGAVEAMADLLLLSREATEKALYIRPYAELRVEIAGFEVPPLLWIQEWDQVGGWAAVSSTLHDLVGDEREAAVAQGFEAVELTGEMQARLETAGSALAGHPDYPDMVRSLAYQASLFETLARYRVAFLRYYRWTETGEGDWRPAAQRFTELAREHHRAWGDDLDFPAFDFRPALRGFERAERGMEAAWAARGLLAGLAGLLLLGVPGVARRTPDHPGKATAATLWTGTTAPWRLGDDPVHSPGAAWAVAVLLVVASAVAVLVVLAVDAPGAVLGVAALVAVFAGLVGLTVGGGSRKELAWGVAGAAPLLVAVAAVLAVVAVRGPDLFWTVVWTDDLLRGLLVSVACTAAVWTLLATGLRSVRTRGRGTVATAGGTLVVVGGTLLALALLLPEAERALVALDDPMMILPMTRAIVNGITVYAGIPDVTGWLPAGAGIALVAVGLLVRRGRPLSGGVARPGGSA